MNNQKHPGNYRSPRSWHINPKLVPLKALIFLLNGASNAIYPFFTIHMLAMGLTLTDTGIIFALLPIFGCIGMPLFGALADKIVMIIFVVFSIICHVCLGFLVPVFKEQVITTNHSSIPLNATISCNPNSINFRLQNNCKINRSVLLTSDVQIIKCIITGDHRQQELSYHFDQLQSIKNLVYQKVMLDEDPSTAKYQICNGNRNLSYSVTCRVRLPMPLSCSRTVTFGNRLTTFFWYTLFRVLGGTAVSCVMQLLDSSTFLMTKHHNGDFGFQRMYGTLGALIFPPLSGTLIQIATKNSGQQNYSPAFYMFSLMSTFGVILMLFMDLQIKPPAKQIWSNIFRLLKNARVSSFIVVMFFVGCCYGALENYLFWYMEKFLGSPKYLLGFTNLVSGLAAIPVVALSSWIIKLTGHTKIFMLSLLIYGVRFLCYSFVYNPFLVLPIEILEAYTYSLTWVTATIYSGKISPDYIGTLEGIIGSMHYAIGRGSGALIAGILFDHFPARLVYQSIAGCCFGLSVIYGLLHYIWLRKLPDPKTNEAVSKEAEPDNLTVDDILLSNEAILELDNRT